MILRLFLIIVNSWIIKKMKLNVYAPDYEDLRPAKPGDAGIDLCAMIDRPIVIKLGTPMVVPLGVWTEFSEDYVGRIQPRSGHAKRGLVAVSGVIDSGYRGQWHAIIFNVGPEDMELKPRERCCQMIFEQRVELTLNPVGSLSELGRSERGETGFGSSGLT